MQLFSKLLNKYKIFPLFKIASVILSSNSLIGTKIRPSFYDLFLPSLLVTFLPPLIANSIYCRFKLTLDGLMTYGIGFILSIVVCRNKFLISLLSEIPHISKLFSLIEMKNSKEDIYTLIAWNITCDVIRTALKKFIKGESLQIKSSFLTNIIISNCGVVFLRMYNLSDYYVIIIANLLPLLAALLFSLGEEEIKIIQQEEGISKKSSDKMKKKTKTSANDKEVIDEKKVTRKSSKSKYLKE